MSVRLVDGVSPGRLAGTPPVSREASEKSAPTEKSAPRSRAGSIVDGAKKLSTKLKTLRRRSLGEDSLSSQRGSGVSGGSMPSGSLPSSRVGSVKSSSPMPKFRQGRRATQELMAEPPLATGWLLKQGHVRRSWKRRFFVLVNNQLRYFEDVEPGSNSTRGLDLRGTVMISGCRPHGHRPRMLELEAHPKSLLVQAEDDASFRMWVEAFRKSIYQLQMMSPTNSVRRKPPRPPTAPLLPYTHLARGAQRVCAGRTISTSALITSLLSAVPDPRWQMRSQSTSMRSASGSFRSERTEEPSLSSAAISAEPSKSDGEYNGGALGPSSRTVSITPGSDVRQQSLENNPRWQAQQKRRGPAAAPAATGTAAPALSPEAAFAKRVSEELEKTVSAEKSAAEEEAAGAATEAEERVAAQVAVRVKARVEARVEASGAEEAAPVKLPVNRFISDGTSIKGEGSSREGGGAPRKTVVTLDDFEIARVLGKGSFATVALAVYKESGESFALKSLNKRHLMMTRQVEATKTEREILRTTRHPFLVRLHWAFQSEQCLHFVLTYMAGGDLYDRMEDEGKLKVERVQLYMAELSLALGHLHDALGVIYRDVKPDNVLVDGQGHACLADFGLAKLNGEASTFCGTQNYMAPEVVKSMVHDKACDWWGLGCLVYELLEGQTPFAHDNPLMVQRNILKQPIVMPEAMPAATADLVTRLLERDAAKRLGGGADGTRDVQAHPFWAPLDFEKVLTRAYTPEWQPNEAFRSRPGDPGSGNGADGNGDEEFRPLPTDESDDDDDDLPGGQRVSLFRGFSYRRESMSHIPEESERKTLSGSAETPDSTSRKTGSLFDRVSRRTTGADKSENRI